MLADLPFLGAGLVYQHALHAEIMAHRDGIDFLEVPTDQFLRHGPEWGEELEELKHAFKTVAHSLYLSLGDAKGPHVAYLDRVRPFLDDLGPAWYSDHFDMGNVPDSEFGQYFHGMQVPFTQEQAEIFRSNMAFVTNRLQRPLLAENIFYKFVFPMPSSLPEPVFIGEALKGSDCGLLLDLTNLDINAMNFGFDANEWLAAAPLEHTVEIHVAGGELRTEGSWKGKWADTHNHPVPDVVWRMVEHVVSQTPVRAITLEWDQNYPPMSVLMEQLSIARGILAQSTAAPRAPVAAPPGSGG